MSWLRWFFAGLLALLLAATFAVYSAPAQWLDWGLSRYSGGRLRLAESAGTIWNGTGRLVLVDPTSSATASGVLEGMAIPGIAQWRVRPWSLLVGGIDASLAVEGAGSPLRLTGTTSEMRISSLNWQIGGLELARLGSPWNTIRPQGAVKLRSEGLTIRQGLVEGRMSIELLDTASALSPVKPLGSYRIDVQSERSATRLSIETLSGPLTLNGQGSWSNQRGLSFVAEATAAGQERERLQSFLVLIGRREGEKTIIRIGA